MKAHGCQCDTLDKSVISTAGILYAQSFAIFGLSGSHGPSCSHRARDQPRRAEAPVLARSISLLITHLVCKGQKSY